MADVPAAETLLREQNERDGTDYRLLRVFDGEGRRRAVEVPLALVAVDGDGAVLQAHVWERTLEQMSFGVESRATVCSMNEAEAAYFLLRERGYEDVHVLVPQVRAGQLTKGLMKRLKAIPTGMAHFYRLLDGVANERLLAWYEQQDKEN